MCQLFSHLTVERGYSRYNCELRLVGSMLHPSIEAEDHTVGILSVSDFEKMELEEALDALWLRAEYQTIRRLPKSGYILFSVRSTTEPLK